MLREFKFLGRISSKNSELERENVPVNPKESLVTHTITDSTRAPLHSIPEPVHNHKVLPQQETSVKSKRIPRTPIKDKEKSSGTEWPLHTPDKHGLSSKNRFGWAQRNELQDDTSSSTIQMGKGIGSFASTTTPKSTRTMGKAISNYSESNSSQTTPTKSVSKPQNSAFCLTSGSRPPMNGGAHRTGNYAVMSKGLPITCNSSTIVNTVEVPHFDLKEDPSFWMEHNVQVVIRVRPLNNNEKAVNGYNRCLKQESAQCITWIGHPETRFTFDHVACETIDQETLFRMVGLPMVENCLSGYHSCVFAYGQTGSGKTYTMLGEMGELEVRPSPERGMIARIFEFLFARIRAEEDIRSDERLKYSCRCSFLEIYNEQITDLLEPAATNLQLREDTKNGVYVENLTEFEVETVGDILKLLSQGSLNRRVATTNMNRESSRSHSVFTCVIESTWEKDSTTNSRFSRMNLVDLAGSERQKSSGAEGERLKEAASINKSLSTLGHVIMVLVDIAQGKARHVPYRDSRLTFLLQDSLGGNSKTMIIANVSPSICCAAETLNTLKFAQRAKLIQNNAVVNEDSSGDITALQNQIRLLKEELNTLKRQNVFRTLSFGPKAPGESSLEPDDSCKIRSVETNQQSVDNLPANDLKGSRRLSLKQMKSLESTLAGALRREQMSEISIKKLEAEIEQLNRMVRQREEYTQCTNMMLKLREEKIQRMESLVGGLIPAESYLLEENRALSAEIKLLQAKVDKNPEVTRFAMEYDRVLEQVRKYQDFYEEGEREMLLAEVSKLRNQLVHLLDGNSKQHSHLKIDMPDQSNRMLCELEECRINLNSCLEKNEKLTREIEDLRASLSNFTAPPDNDSAIEVIKESIVEAATSGDDQSLGTICEDGSQMKLDTLMKPAEDIMNLELELDILKQILKEERSSRADIEKKELSFYKDLQFTKEQLSSMTRKFEEVNGELEEAKTVIEALESQQLFSINELEDLRNRNCHFAELVNKQEMEISTLKEQSFCQKERDRPPPNESKSEGSALQMRLKKMQNSLEKAKKLNTQYQRDHVLGETNEVEMDEIRNQVEAETAAVIVCLQDELADLQRQVQESNIKETHSEQKIILLDQDNKRMIEEVQEKEKELKALSEKWELLTREIEIVLADGNEALDDVFDQVEFSSGSLPQKEIFVPDQIKRFRKIIMEKDMLIRELNQCLEDANCRTSDLECKLRSLKGATLVITEAHQQECNETRNEIQDLNGQLSSKAFKIEQLKNNIRLGKEQLEKTAKSATVAFVVVNRLSELYSSNLDALEQDISEAHQREYNDKQREALALNELLSSKAYEIQELQSKIRLAEEQLKKTATSAIVAFVIVNRLSEVNSMNLHELKKKDKSICSLGVEINKAETLIQSLRKELDMSGEICDKLRLQLSTEQQRACAMESKLLEIEHSEILETNEKLAELKAGVSTLRSCMDNYASSKDAMISNNDENEALASGETNVWRKTAESCAFGETKNSVSSVKDLDRHHLYKNAGDRDDTIILLRKEIESALESLKAVQAEMTKLRKEKEEMVTSERNIRESTKSVVTKLVSLQKDMSNFENQVGLKMGAFDHKLLAVEDTLQDIGSFRCQEKELLETELGNAKAVAAQQSAEASCILAKFEEAQDTVREADIVINELMIANETFKLKIEGLKRKKATLMEEKGVLSRQVQSLQSTNETNHFHCKNLENQYASDLLEMKNMVSDLEGIIAEIHTNSNKEFASLSNDFLCIKSQLQESFKPIRSCVEEIWSEIVIKDCAISVLHLCHMGLLLETVTGLNTENGLLHHGISESNSVINELKEYNFRSRRELELCRDLKGKLLADITKGFDRISRKENEAGELTVKLAGFQKTMLDLQEQEQLMLERSDHMGFELSILMKELEQSNGNILNSLKENENLLKNREEVLESLEESSMIELSAKDFELLILASYFQSETLNYSENLEKMNRHIVFSIIDGEMKEQILLENEDKLSLLINEIQEEKRVSQDLLSEITERNSTIEQFGKLKEALENEVELYRCSALSSDILKSQLGEVTEAKARLMSQVQELEVENQRLGEELKEKEMELELAFTQITAIDNEKKVLQEENMLHKASLDKALNELKEKDEEIRTLSCLEAEKELMERENQRLGEELKEKEMELELAFTQITALDNEKKVLQEENMLHKASLDKALNELKEKDEEVRTLSCLEAEKELMERELRKLKATYCSVFQNMDVKDSELILNINRAVDSMENLNIVGSKISRALNGEMIQQMTDALQSTDKFVKELEILESSFSEIMTENLSLQTESLRKDEVLNGLLFDLRLLQESASSNKDQKDEIEELVASLDALEDELAVRMRDLDAAVEKIGIVEAQLEEKTEVMSSLELDNSKLHETINSLSSENLELNASIKSALEAKNSAEEDLFESRKVNEALEREHEELDSALRTLKNSLETLRMDFHEVCSERDNLQAVILIAKQELEVAEALGHENEEIAKEAQEIAESRRVYAEEKDEEVKLLEKSVEELECTVDVLENKVNIIKGEAERQQLEREDLETELHTLKQQTFNVKGIDADMKRSVDEKAKELQQALGRIQILEKEIAAKDAEISQCKSHIMELNLQAEAQARDYKQKFKALESMAEQVKPEVTSTHGTNSSSNKLEKNGSKPRGSGSPFKCIGLGLSQQIKSEKDEELNASRLHIEELEALAANRQKEIFMLNARLAATDSMTHDLLRELSGLKLDMTKYASLLDNELLQKIAEKPGVQSFESQVKDQEVIKLKKQLNEFIEERKGWLEEIDRKQAEMIAAQVALEELHQRERLLSTENEMIKSEHANHKRKINELEMEAKKLSGQQNLQQRIHHHAKIKEENNLLRSQIEELSNKLRRRDSDFARIREELARYRIRNGSSPNINFDEEHRLNHLLKEAEEDRLQLAQKLGGLCTSILKAAGVTKPDSSISISAAEEALDQIKSRITSLERELQDVNFKNIISTEKIRLSELMPQQSPLSPRADENWPMNRAPHSPFFSALDR